VFPCFDQPDLKATWKFSAMTDSDWSIISNNVHAEAGSEEQLNQVLEQTRQVFGEELKLTDAKAHLFMESERYSTYLYAIVAGPYGYFERQTEGLPPMRIYARKSLVDQINHQLMFDVTEGGMIFY